VVAAGVTAAIAWQFGAGVAAIAELALCAAGCAVLVAVVLMAVFLRKTLKDTRDIQQVMPFGEAMRRSAAVRGPSNAALGRRLRALENRPVLHVYLDDSADAEASPWTARQQATERKQLPGRRSWPREDQP
jgi:hypothetical protein